VEIDIGITDSTSRWILFILWSVALERGLRLDHRAIHAEVFPEQQAAPFDLAEHPGKEASCNISFQ